MPIVTEFSALEDFSGTIKITNGRLIGDFAENYLIGDESFKNFPKVDLSFFSHEGQLILINRDRQESLQDNSFWELFLNQAKFGLNLMMVGLGQVFH
jgi:hypothetical protein